MEQALCNHTIPLILSYLAFHFLIASGAIHRSCESHHAAASQGPQEMRRHPIRRVQQALCNHSISPILSYLAFHLRIVSGAIHWPCESHHAAASEGPQEGRRHPLRRDGTRRHAVTRCGLPPPRSPAHLLRLPCLRRMLAMWLITLAIHRSLSGSTWWRRT